MNLYITYIPAKGYYLLERREPKDATEAPVQVDTATLAVAVALLEYADSVHIGLPENLGARQEMMAYKGDQCDLIVTVESRQTK